jgi:hypothetical protein
MKKTFIANLNIGLFFSPENLEKGTLITQALEKEGANVRIIKNEEDLNITLHDMIGRDDEHILDAILFDSTVFGVDTADTLVKAKISPIAIDFSLPKGARVQAGESRILGSFIQEIFTREPQAV